MKYFTPVAVACLLAVNTARAAESVLIEENGFIVFEAESVPPVGEWLSTSQVAGYSGSGYFQWAGPTLLSAAKAGRDTLTYHFRINTPGNYELRWRSRIAVGNNRTEHNDSWVRFATGTNVSGEHALNGWTKVYMNKLNEWSWQSNTVDHVGKPIRQFFSAGDHTIEISGRSTGHAIDRVVLYQYESHSFSEEAFDTAAVSPSTQGPVALVVPEQTAPTEQPVQQTPAPQAVNTDSNVEPAPPASCTKDRAIVGATERLYVQGERIITNGELRVEHGNRTTYLQFDTSDVPENYDAVVLQFDVGSDSGSGPLDIYAAGHNNWGNQTANISDLPSASVLAGSKTSQWTSQTESEVALDAAVLSNGVLSLILQLQSSSADFSILSADNAPRLVFISHNTDYCDNAASQVSTEDTALETAAALPESDNTSADVEAGGGSAGLWLAWLIVLSGFANPRAWTGRKTT